LETATATKRLYEAMFLVDSAQAAGDWDGTMGAIETVLKRADAEVVLLRKWSERRLAYDMGKVSRGTYLLCYFRAEPQRIMGVEKDVRLSEMILRMLILSAEGRPEGFNEKDSSEEPVEEAKTPAEASPEATPAPKAKDSAETAPAAPAKSTATPAPASAEATEAEPVAPAESAADTPATEEKKEQ